MHVPAGSKYQYVNKLHELRVNDEM